MKTIQFRTIVPFIFFITLFFLVPTHAHASDTVNATLFYTIDFAINADDEDIHIPVIAERGSSELNTIGFDVLQGKYKNVLKKGAASGFVVSSLPIDADLTYTVPAGSTHFFTLYIIYSHEEIRKKTPYQVELRGLIPTVLAENFSFTGVRATFKIAGE
ncbi:hypothetical protein GW943_02370 [Candidatus Parcubacteria bacterium]|uniref:Uncharacterized protein n=1 Tax=Candidatus Kaiserbacteria bacterium CG10_big_fil_rev_8_21_14_0_10_47_16 TaxID=1974608 RepID=A0A2H0UFF1_9BACT|nr:hypothetical protein [Candidatus Parcubacteria bacterium]PIR84515.1 MAG: hypothetical protein COU16_02980 [Candidatus Kaiserbacteria bacterium CG10_big_fil_rev_8_21_14_0_10_47_16]